MAFPLSPQVFSITSQLIEDAVGLHYGPSEAGLLAERLSARALELEFDSLLDYYYFLRYDERGPGELDALVDLLVVNETYFFREADQLRILAGRLLQGPLEERPFVRIWCAACSTGEEALTLAMMLDDSGVLGRTEILATDISARALQRAEQGVYAGRSLRVLGSADRRRHFHDVGDGAVRVRDDLRARIQWRRVNLFDVARVEALGVFDVILSRNVLIYFQDETVTRLVQRFAKSMRPRGLLLVGASESLLRFGTAFDCEEHDGAFFYRKGAE